MQLSWQEYWSGLPFPSPGDLPDTGIKPGPPALQADSLLSEPPGKPCGKRENSKPSSSVRDDHTEDERCCDTEAEGLECSLQGGLVAR